MIMDDTDRIMASEPVVCAAIGAVEIGLSVISLFVTSRPQRATYEECRQHYGYCVPTFNMLEMVLGKSHSS